MINLCVVAPPNQKEEFYNFIERLKQNYSVEEYDFKKSYSQPDSYFLIIGGDGTLNYFISTYKFENTPKVLYIPYGTANDFAKSVFTEVPALNSVCIQRILKRNSIIKVPIMKLNEKSFINVATCGPPAEITDDDDSHVKKAIGQMSYYLSGIKKLFSDNKLSIEVEINGTSKKVDTCGFLVSQGLFAGGGVRVNPSFTACFGDDFSFLSTNDGKLFSSLQLISELTFSNEVKEKDEFELHFIKSLKIKSSKDIPIKLDGESYQASELHFQKSKNFIELFLF